MHERLARVTLIGLLIFMPLAFGAVDAWSQLIVLSGSGILLLCLTVHAWRQRSAGGLAWTVAYVPLAGFLALGLLQALPLPAGLVGWLSPHAAGLQQELREDSFVTLPLSLNPRMTWQVLCDLVAAAVIFLTVLNFYRHGEQIKRLLLTVGLLGAVLAALALLQAVFGNHHFYWIGPQEVQPNSGTFGCHNHFAQHMNLSVMAMLAYAMVHIREALGHHWLDRDRIGEWFGSKSLKGARWLLICAVVGILAVAMSLSRMGIATSLIAVAAMALILRDRKESGKANIPLAVGLAALAAVLLVGVDTLYERITTLSYEKRWQVIVDLLPAYAHYPLLGSGLGSFEVVYPMYDHGTSPLYASHAENEYAQLFLETGIVGFGLVAWFVAVVGRSAMRAMQDRSRPLTMAVPALSAGLIAVMVHSWTDFGQHIPAVAGLSAVFCGLLVVLGQRADQVQRRQTAAAAPGSSPSGSSEIPEAGTARDSSHAIPDPAAFWRTQCMIGILVLSSVVVVLNIPATAMRILGEQCNYAATDLANRMAKAHWRATDDDYTRLVSLGERAVAYEPANATYRYRLGVYRWRAAVKGRSKSEIGTDVTPEMQQAAQQVVDEMTAATALCPTLGSLHCLKGQMTWWVLGFADGREEVEQGIRLARNDGVSWFAAGLLAARDGKPEVALDRFRHSVEVKSGMLLEAMNVLVDECHRPDLVIALAGDDPEKLFDASKVLQRAGLPDDARRVRDQSIAAYRLQLDDPTLEAWVFAMLADDASGRDRHTEAADLYRRAVAKQYIRQEWHLALARELTAAGQYDEAETELDIVGRLAPGVQPAVYAVRKQIDAARKPATREDKPAMQEGKPAMQEGKPATQESN